MEEYLRNLTETLLRQEDRDLDHDHDHDEEDDSDVMVAKGVAMISLFVLSMICGIIPMKLNSWLKTKQKNKKVKRCSKQHHEDSLEEDRAPEIDERKHEEIPFKKPRVVQLLLNFGGGVLMATTFLHLLPEVKENVDALHEEGRIPELPFPLAELLMCFGFFIMFFIDESVHVYIHRRERINAALLKAGEDEKLEDIFNRNLSFRKRGRDNSLCQKNVCTNTDQNLNESCGEICVISGRSEVNPSPKRIDKDDALVRNVRGLLIVLALSVHELFEGLAVGLSGSTSNVYYLFGAVSAHKLVIAFCIGIELVTSNLKTKLVIAYIFTFAVVSPLGIGLGLVVSSNAANGFATTVLQGMACGTLLYVIFFEILLPSVQGKHEHSHFGDATHDHHNESPAYDYFTSPPPNYSSRDGLHTPEPSPSKKGTSETKQEIYKSFDENISTTNIVKEEDTRGRVFASAKVHSEVNHKHHGHHHMSAWSDFSGLLQYLAVLAGFLFMLGLQFATGHQHSHGGGGDHGHSHEVHEH
uniref:Putative fe2+/zn2+ regulated transporter n=1 Tax=Xenopsylla cheopis TaxID=163159 RepID=A0A6M2DKX7_XENCH